MRMIPACVLLMLVSLTTLARSPAPGDAEVYIIAPSDGATVSSPVTVRFGLRNMGVAPAGVEREATGHHHLLIDTESPAPEQSMDQPIPANDHYRHFGGGQTETTLQLEPGTHTLQLLLGDHNHIPHEPAVISEPVTITVEE